MSSPRKLQFAVVLAGVVCLLSPQSNAVVYGGVDFPAGAVSFADEVVSYSPNGAVLAPHNNPNAALGIPDFGGDGDYVSLGDLGVLVLRFTDNSLTTNGNGDEDLWVFEIGGAIEPVGVEISTNGLDWIDVGSTSGATSGVDIDSFIGFGVVEFELYSYVRLTDLLPHQSGSPFEGADIDAVGAISSSAPVPVPEPATLMLFGLGLSGLGLRIRKKS